MKLHLNDFPEEVLWTLSVEGAELDVEETPEHWIFSLERDDEAAKSE